MIIIVIFSKRGGHYNYAVFFRLVGITYDWLILEESCNPTEHCIKFWCVCTENGNVCLFLIKFIKMLLYNIITKLIILKFIVFIKYKKLKNCGTNF